MGHFAWNYEDGEGAVLGQGSVLVASFVLVSTRDISGVPRIIKRAT